MSETACEDESERSESLLESACLAPGVGVGEGSEWEGYSDTGGGGVGGVQEL